MDCTIEAEIREMQNRHDKEIEDMVKRYISIKLAEFFSLNPTARVTWFYEQGYDDDSYYDSMSEPRVLIDGADEEDLEVASQDVSILYSEWVLSLIAGHCKQIVATKDGVDVS